MQGNTEKFIGRWERSSASERANYALFLSELATIWIFPDRNLARQMKAPTSM